MPTQNTANPGQGSSTVGVDYTYFFYFTVDQDFGGESWLAGDILIGNLTGDNIVYRSGQWRVRYQATTQITMGRYGIRINAGGLGLNQTDVTVGAGAVDLHDTGSGTLKTSWILISASTGAFSIDSIAIPTHQNQVLYIKNQTANNMTINDVAVAGAAPAGYWTILTQTGAAVATTGVGIAHFIANENANCWELVSIQG